MDPQANASTGVGIDKRSLKYTSYNILMDSCTVSEALVKTMIPGLSLIPSSIELIGAEIELVDRHEREKCLTKMLEPYKNMFDYIIHRLPSIHGTFNFEFIGFGEFCFGAAAV